MYIWLTFSVTGRNDTQVGGMKDRRKVRKIRYEKITREAIRREF